MSSPAIPHPTHSEAPAAPTPVCRSRGDDRPLARGRCRVMVIDDEEPVRRACQKILERAGYEVETFGRGQDGLERIALLPPALLVVDLKMPELNGFQIIDRVRQLDRDIVIVVITGYATVATAVDAMKAGAYDFLPKPFTPEELRVIAQRGLERWTLSREAERLRREKAATERRFVTFVSHQLKSPLVAVKQYLDVLAHGSLGPLPAATVEWIDRSRLRLGEMLELIHDWLALSRIESEALARRNDATSLPLVVRQTIDEVGALAGASKIQLSADVPDELPSVRGDQLCMRMLVVNLVTNAIKYNRPGGAVTVRARRDGGFAILQVIDTGIGIPQDQLARIFDEFVRIASPASPDVPGSGLGLTICKRIVDELGGRIEVESVLGQGTTFKVRLPLAETDAASGPGGNDGDKQARADHR